MHNLILVAAICGAAATGVITGSAHAQTVQETYAALCGKGQQSETCDTLAKALQESKTAQATPSAALHDPVWGPLARLAGTRWVVATGDIALIDQFEWIENGSAIRFTSGWMGANPDMTVAFRPGRKSGVVLADITTPDDGSKTVRFHFDADGVLLSDWFRRFTFMGMGGSSERLEFRLSEDGRYERRHAMSAEKGDQPPFPPLHGQYRQYSDAELVPIMARSRAGVQAFDDAVAAQMVELQRQEERESGERWSAAMGAINGALDVGLEVARAHEAESRYELDATLADVDARIAREQAGSGYAVSQAPVPAAAPVAPYTPAQSGSGAGSPAAQPDAVAGESAKPLQFVLTISMRNLPGDTHNPTCYSNVITRPGPPGWGAPGFLPSGSAEQALREIDALKGEFIAACRRSGREITSEGNFSHIRNQYDGDEQRMRATQPRFAEDVSVVLN